MSQKIKFEPHSSKKRDEEDEPPLVSGHQAGTSTLGQKMRLEVLQLRNQQQQAVISHGENTDEGASSARISLNVRGQDGNVMSFSVRKGTCLKKIMNTYCEKMSLNPFSIVFLFDGRGIRREQTPEELQMEDGDEIDAMLHQSGAGAFRNVVVGRIWST